MAFNPKTLTLISSLLLLSILLLISATTTSATHDEGEVSNPNPYLFNEERFKHWVRSKDGSIKVLERFHERSDLLLGISNYRLQILNMDPHAFMMPIHSDVNFVIYVANGEAVMNILSKEDKDSVTLRKGDIIKISAGYIVTLLNTHDNENFNAIMLLQPISTPGSFEVFLPIGGQDPESYLRSFSDEVLRAAYNAEAEKVKGVFGKQSRGVIFKAPEEKVKAIRRHRGVPQRAFNLLRKRPISQSNERGKLYEANANDYRELRSFDVEVTFANISGGSMMEPFYHMWATKVSFILSGKGWAEMVCPQMESHQKGQGQHYQQVKSNLTPGTVLVTPPGHPVAIVASKGSENLQILSFDIHADNNQRIFLAGTNNVFKGMDKEVKELAFDASESEVDAILDAQKSEVFVPGPDEESQILASVFGFMGFK